MLHKEKIWAEGEVFEVQIFSLISLMHRSRISLSDILFIFLLF